jgi:hypothetical protein
LTMSPSLSARRTVQLTPPPARAVSRAANRVEFDGVEGFARLLWPAVGEGPGAANDAFDAGALSGRDKRGVRGAHCFAARFAFSLVKMETPVLARGPAFFAFMPPPAGP